MELSRRDALAALAAGGALFGGGTVLEWAGSDALGEHEAATLEAVARVVYPAAATGIPEFVESYVVGRARDRPAHAEGVAEAVGALDGYARSWYDGRYADLDSGDQESLLAEMGVDRADPDPAGDDPERVRYYLVNDLLYALYTSPTGGKLVGIENPQGHRGGRESYRRGPR